MNTTTITATTTATGMDDLDNIDNMNDINNINNINNMSDMSLNDNPGAQLAAIREQHGYSAEYVASKLHLRVCMIERLEADDYQDMPEPVFIKGYLRAYANLVGVKYEPLLASFNRFHASTKRGQERTLWQTRRQTHQVEHVTRWVTGAFAVIVVVAVAWWWSKSKDVETLFSAHTHQVDASLAHAESDIRLTDLSNMRTLLAPTTKPKQALLLGAHNE
ncbi:MAG: helix-turn-helix transcriptional regulator [Legionellaceae bacterium]|nr:helix-turn-helix transcriptional regulator [Legionellaceae bacterium]